MPAFSASARKINYSGRLTGTDGKPVSGPIDLQVQFYRTAVGGNPIAGPVLPIFNDVNLTQGVFEITIDLSPTDMNTVFDGNAVYIQLIDLTNQKFYPRQEFSVVPYALKVPVDEETISYNTDGELVINSIKADQIDDGAVTLGKIAACGNADEILKWDGSAWVCAPDEIGASGTGDITSVSTENGLTGGAATGDVTLGIAANGVTTNRLADAAVETVKIADAAITSDKLANTSVSSDKIADAAVTISKLAACANADEILKWNGSAWACAADADTNAGGDVTEVTANDGLTGGGASGALTVGIAANGVTTNRLADAAVETAKIADAAVSSDKLANASVSSDKIINAAVSTDKIADAAVTVGKLAACANADEILKWNGSAWACAADADTNAGGDVTEVTANDGLTGGGASGALTVGIAANGVTTNRLADAAVETAKIANSAVSSDKIADAAITVGKLAACANADEILKWNGSAWICAEDEIGANGTGDITGVTAENGLSGGGASGDLNIGIAANGVTTNRLADAAVETDKLANGAVTLAKIAACDNADEILKWNGSAWTCGTDVDTNSGGDITGVTAGAGLTGTAASGEATLSIVDEGVTTAKIANAAVINDKLANASVSSDKIINAAVGTDKIADAAITVGKLAACANADEILKWNGSAWVCAADADTNSGGDITGVTANDGLSGGGATGALTVGIAANGVTTNRLADLAVETAKIANNAVTDAKLADGAVTLAKIAACANADEILKWNGSTWTCGSDANAGGDITGVTAGTGLSGGGASGAVTVDLDVSELTAESNVADNDLIPIYDTSASAHRKMARSDLVSGLESTSNKGAASGYASLNASSKVVQDPANAQTTAAAGKIPMTGVGTTLDKDWLPAMVGDSGAGGSKGAVPAPASGDAAAGKFLKADGSWTAPFATSFTQNDSQYIATDEIRARDAGGLKLYDDSGANGIFVEDGGEVGIGTESPISKLDVAGGLSLKSALTNSDARPAISATRIPSEISGYSSSGHLWDDGFLRLSAGGGTNATSKSFIDVSGFSLVPDRDNNLVFGTAGLERMRIDNNGRVGIGTSSPGIDFVGTHDYGVGVSLMQVKGTHARLIATGTTSVGLDLIDQDEAADKKWMQLYSGAGLTRFRTLTDTGTVASNVMTMDHTTSAITIPGAVEIKDWMPIVFKYGPTGYTASPHAFLLKFSATKGWQFGLSGGNVLIYFGGRASNNSHVNEVWNFAWYPNWMGEWGYYLQRLSGTSQVVPYLISANNGNSNDGILQIEFKIGTSTLFQDGIEVTVLEMGAGHNKWGRTGASWSVITEDQAGTPISTLTPWYHGTLSVSGNLGVGVATSATTYKLQVNGQPAANGYTAFTNYSDRRLKKNIQLLPEGSLEKILKLKPATFNYNDLSGYDKETQDRLVTGFIAQELKEIFPEMVGRTEINGTEYLDTDLSALQIHLVRALQEQHEIIKQQSVTIEDLNRRIKALEETSN